jgi:hypothetical protein
VQKYAFIGQNKQKMQNFSAQKAYALLQKFHQQCYCKNEISNFFHPGSKILPSKQCNDAISPPVIIDFDTVFLYFIRPELSEISFPALICVFFSLYLYKPWRYAPVHGMCVA